MSQSAEFSRPPLITRLRERHGRRAAGLALALLVEGLLVLLLLAFAPSVLPDKVVEMTLSTFNVLPVETPTEAPAPPAAGAPAAQPVEATSTSRTPPTPRPAPPAPIEAPAPPVAVPWIELSREQMASADSAVRPAAPAASAAPPGPVYGPTGTRGAGSGDTPRAEGSGPNGEPLYAAAWYREPYDDELRGFLSTARGPGWGIIACRTAPGYRVENCVMVGESPQGSNIARAVLAAAWQFQVRPPRIGGRPQIGEWVRIRIDYDIRQR